GDFFFFQAEDGIRDWSVTGVQTCALPISPRVRRRPLRWSPRYPETRPPYAPNRRWPWPRPWCRSRHCRQASALVPRLRTSPERRSEERRVGKECSARGPTKYEKKQKKGGQ